MATPRKDPKDYLKVGRPSLYTLELAATICRRLAEGESLNKIVKDPDMPSTQTVYQWLFKYPEFHEKYVRAREDQADTYADQIVAIADEQPELIEIKDKEGNVVDHKLDSAYVSWQKNRIDARKWTASKLKPKKYSDKIVHSGDEANPVVIENNLNVFGEIIKNMKMTRQDEKK